MHIVTNLWSTAFAIGLVAGFLLSRLWCIVKTCWLNRRRPLPNGKRRSIRDAVRVDRRWIIGIVGACFLVWSVVTTSQNASGNERNAAQAAAFAARVQDCQRQLVEAINASRAVTAENERISAENDRLSREERTLLADGQRRLVEWIGDLLNPQDPNVRNRTTADPVRQQYNLDRTRQFFDAAGALNDRIVKIHETQDQNERDRPKSRPALPDPNCGE